MESNKYYTFWVCVRRRRYPACYACAPYCPRPGRLYNIFPQYLVNGTNFRRSTEHEICVSIHSTDFIWNISHSRKNWTRYLKRVAVFMYSKRYSCPILMYLEFSRKIFDEYSNIKFHENPKIFDKYKISWKSEGFRQI